LVAATCWMLWVADSLVKAKFWCGLENKLFGHATEFSGQTGKRISACQVGRTSTRLWYITLSIANLDHGILVTVQSVANRN